MKEIRELRSVLNPANRRGAHPRIGNARTAAIGRNLVGVTVELGMPILHIDLVHEALHPGLAQRIANSAGEALGTPAGQTWVHLHEIVQYAENHADAPSPSPIFVRVLLADPPADLAATATELNEAIAIACNQPHELVHIVFEAPARGRIAFGGLLRT